MSGNAVADESPDYLPSTSAADKRAIEKWYATACAALSRNRPLAIAASVPTDAAASLALVLSASEMAALEAVGAFKSSTPTDRNPLLEGQAHYMALLEESLSTAQVAKLLKVDVSRVRQRLRDRSLFGIEHENSWRLPRFQFEGRHALPGLAKVLKSLPADLFPLDVVDWFLLPNSELELEADTGASSPREWLLAGRPVKAVVDAASEFDCR